MAKTFAGSWSYMAPEVFDRELYNHRADIWYVDDYISSFRSFGAILLRLLTGYKFQAGRGRDAYRQFKDVGELRPKISPGLFDLLSRTLCKIQEERIDGMAFYRHAWLFPDWHVDYSDRDFPEEALRSPFKTISMKLPRVETPPRQVHKHTKTPSDSPFDAAKKLINSSPFLIRISNSIKEADISERITVLIHLMSSVWPEWPLLATPDLSQALLALMQIEVNTLEAAIEAFPKSLE